MDVQAELALIHRAADGDADAFGALMRTYERQVYNLTLRMTGNPDDALDLSQEAFLRAWRGLGGYRFDSAFSTWLYRLASNVCIDFLRRRKKQKTIPLYTAGEDGEERELPIPDPNADAEAAVLRSLEREDMARAMARLEPEYREALVLRAVYGLSYQEIGERLDIREGTVKSRIARAREKMRRMMKKTGTNPPPDRPIGGKEGSRHDL